MTHGTITKKIRTYMAQSGVNYTTAKRHLDEVHHAESAFAALGGDRDALAALLADHTLPPVAVRVAWKHYIDRDPGGRPDVGSILAVIAHPSASWAIRSQAVNAIIDYHQHPRPWGPSAASDRAHAALVALASSPRIEPYTDMLLDEPDVRGDVLEALARNPAVTEATVTWIVDHAVETVRAVDDGLAQAILDHPRLGTETFEFFIEHLERWARQTAQPPSSLRSGLVTLERAIDFDDPDLARTAARHMLTFGERGERTLRRWMDKNGNLIEPAVRDALIDTLREHTAAPR